MHLRYDGNVAELFLDGKKVADQFSLGNGWSLGLRRFGATAYTLRIFALDEKASVYMEYQPAFRNGFACSLNGVTATAEYTVSFRV